MASTFAAYCSQLIHYPELGFSLDLSRAPAPAGFAERMAPAMRAAAQPFHNVWHPMGMTFPSSSVTTTASAQAKRAAISMT